MIATHLTATNDRDAWLAARRECITATDAAAVAGVHPYKTPREVWLEKLGETGEKTPNEAMHWGNVLEPLIIAEFGRRNEVEVLPTGFTRHATLPFGATPDGLIGTDELLEVKTAGINAGQNFGPSGTDEVPVQYLVQVQWQLLCTGRSIGHLAVLIAGQDYREYRIVRDDQLLDKLTRICKRFWDQHVVLRTSPPVTAYDSDLLASQFPVGDESQIVNATEEIDLICDELKEAKEVERRATEKVDLLTNKLKDFMGSATVLETSIGKFTWRNGKDRIETDYRAILAEINAPTELIARHQEVKPGARVFRTPIRTNRA